MAEIKDLGLSPLWTSDEIAAATGGVASAPFDVSGVSIDTRSLESGDLFVALTGGRDGHDFIPSALAAGAAGSLSTRSAMGCCVVVDDTLAGLRRLGEAARIRARGAKRGAITGSVGKTSVTQAVRAGLDRAGLAHGSVKSYNNHIGVPLTLARMPAGAKRAIFEIGMNHANEITPLSRMVQPHAVAITTVEAVHIENFPDGEAGVAAAKAEIFAGLERGGVAILNADNRWFEFLKAEARRAGAKTRVFGSSSAADAQLIRYAPAPGGASVEARLDGRAVEFPIRQTGAHWGPMSLCALLMMRALDVDLDTALAALADFEPLEGRGVVITAPLVGGGTFTLIDESYNASPVSVTAALASLRARATSGRRLVALTDMLELGDQGPARHAALAEAIDRADIAQVFCAGPLMKFLWDELPPARRGGWAIDAKSLIPKLVESVAPGDTVMIKGSNASRAGLLVQALVARGAMKGEGG